MDALLLETRQAHDVERRIAPDDEAIDAIRHAMFYDSARSFCGWMT